MARWKGWEPTPSLLGYRVHVDPMLPFRPSPGEVGRRIVRHGMKDVLAWLGEPVGPKPDELTHAFQGGEHLFVSRELYARLKENLPVEANQFVARTPAPVPQINALYRMVIGQQGRLYAPKEER